MIKKRKQAGRVLPIDHRRGDATFPINSVCRPVLRFVFPAVAPPHSVSLVLARSTSIISPFPAARSACAWPLPARPASEWESLCSLEAAAARRLIPSVPPSRETSTRERLEGTAQRQRSTATKKTTTGSANRFTSRVHILFDSPKSCQGPSSPMSFEN